MERRRVVIVSPAGLGWRTHADALADAVRAEGEHVARISIGLPRVVSRVRRAVIGRLRGADPSPASSTGALNTANKQRSISAARLRRVKLRPTDHVHFAPHTLAPADFSACPFSVSVDGLYGQFTEPSWPELDADGVRVLDAERNALASAIHIHATSRAAADGIRHIVDKPVPAHAGTMFITPPPACRSQVPSAPMILFVGRDGARKGAARLLAWHQQHFADRAELCMVALKSTAGADGTERNVRWWSDLPNTRVRAELLPLASVLVLPTSWDLSPLVILEAQAAGVPVVATRMAGIPDMVHHGVNGFVADVNDDAGFVEAIATLIDDPELNARFGSAALATAAERADDDANQKLLRLLLGRA